MFAVAPFILLPKESKINKLFVLFEDNQPNSISSLTFKVK
jgi:hypothetical protein